MGAAAIYATSHHASCDDVSLTIRWPSGGPPPSAEDLAHCPKTCGEPNISYPFGIRKGCFRPGGGFELNMRRHHHLYPPKLFLGNTTEIHDTLSEGGHVNASVIFNIATSTTPHRR
uniref:Wall-associated receptor kinase galacturonan-binding domain-containing protein n=1 Tax=Oryza nivara TaxID=4536 RepID=A0A0E0IUT1_ORYNI